MTITSLAELDEVLRGIRQQQFALQVDQLEVGLACAAVPVHDSVGQVAGALCLAGPTGRAEALLNHVDVLRTHAADLAPHIF